MCEGNGSFKLGQIKSDWNASGSIPQSGWENLVREQMDISRPSFSEKIGDALKQST